MKMIVTDLDGTLLRSDKSISQRTLDVLQELDSHNIKFVIATARAKRSVQKILPFDLNNMYIVYYNGAEIYNGDNLIYHKYIESETVKSIVKWLIHQCSGINIALEISNELYTNFEISVMKGWIPPCTQVDFSSFDYKPAAKILVDIRSGVDVDAIKDVLPEDCKIIITDGGTLGQISHKECSKINAIKSIAKILRYELEDIIAFGDDYNDSKMLMECGTGVAMGNAPDDIKKLANIIAATNDDDGVAIEIERILRLQRRI